MHSESNLQRFRFYLSFVFLGVFALGFAALGYIQFRRGNMAAAVTLSGGALMMVHMWLTGENIFARPLGTLLEDLLKRGDAPVRFRLLYWAGGVLTCIGMIWQFALHLGWVLMLLVVLALVSAHHLPGRWRYFTTLAILMFLLVAMLVDASSLPWAVCC